MNHKLMQKICVAAVVSSVGVAVASPQEWELQYSPFKGEYAIYGGELSDPVPSTRMNKKVAILISGKIAKDLFDAIGPDIKDACGGGGGIRSRQKDHDNLSCVFDPKDGYRCWVGFDLRTGKSIGGVYC